MEVAATRGQEETVEEVKVKVLPDPGAPTKQEVEDHKARNHLPYRAWCPHCVRGKGKSLAHQALEAEKDHTLPTVSMDYCFMGQPDDETTMPILVLKGHGGGATRSHALAAPCR